MFPLPACHRLDYLIEPAIVHFYYSVQDVTLVCIHKILSRIWILERNLHIEEIVDKVYQASLIRLIWYLL